MRQVKVPISESQAHLMTAAEKAFQAVKKERDQIARVLLLGAEIKDGQLLKVMGDGEKYWLLVEVEDE